jgi:hypothetical protein
MTPRATPVHNDRSAVERETKSQVWDTAASTLNTELTGQIESHVQNRLAGRVSGFRVLVRNEGIVLQGQVRTYYTKQLAQHAVMDRTRIPILANEIEVV